MTNEDKERILSRVRKMLRLANDAGATEGKRDNAMRMAHATLAKYNLDIAQAEESGVVGADDRGETEVRLRDRREGQSVDRQEVKPQGESRTLGPRRWASRRDDSGTGIREQRQPSSSVKIGDRNVQERDRSRRRYESFNSSLGSRAQWMRFLES